MKKENKQLAKEKKAAAKKKQEQQMLFKKIAMIAVPAALIVLAVWAVSFAKDPADTTYDTSVSTTVEPEADSATDTATDTAAEPEADPAAEPELSTDPTLVIEDGDIVNIDYVGTIDGVEFAGGSTGGAGADLQIGSNMYIDDFEQQLIGYSAGDTVEVVVTFPEDYGMAELQGKEAVFTTVINGIYK